MHKFHTADLCDAHHEALQVVMPGLHSFGGAIACFGSVTTIALDEDNSDLITLLKSEGNGRVAVVDAKGAYCAIVGDTLMGFAYKNNWAGIIVNGYVRDIVNTQNIAVGLWALGTCPMKSRKKAPSVQGEAVTFLDVTFHEGDYLYADSDGIVLSKERLV